MIMRISNNDSKWPHFDKRKNVKYKCRSCNREWTVHNHKEFCCMFCKSDKINEK